VGSQVGIEDLLRDALSEEARAASEQMADIEFEDEVQTRLPEDLRYGGLYGLMSYLGMQGQGDQEGSQSRRAVIKPKGMPKPGEDQRASTFLGSYYLPEANPDRLAMNVDRTMGLDFYQGSYPNPDEIRYFQSTSPRARELGVGGLDEVSDTVAHELFHRGQSLPFLKDMLEEVNQKMDLADRDSVMGRVKYERLKDERSRLRNLVRKGHYYLDALDKKNPTTSEDKQRRDDLLDIYGYYPIGLDRTRLEELEALQDDIGNYLTPEKQKELGVKLPTPAAKPKEPPGFVERALDYAKDIF
jgi:hypothetical protein